MSFRKTISWCLFPLTMWYSVGVRLRNFLFDIGLKKQVSPSVTTIGVGNLCAGGAGKTPHVEYLLRLLSPQYAAALLSRGYGRRSSGFQLDDGSHDARRLGDEPAMIAHKMPGVQVAVCERRVAGVQQLLQQERPPQVVVLDDAYQHRYIKPTVNILLTEYDRPYYKDRVMPYGNLREPARARYRANIVVVTKSPEKLNPIEKHNMINKLKLMSFQKIFFSYIHYGEPLSLASGTQLPLQTVDSVLLVTGIANPEPLRQHVAERCNVTQLTFADHHNYTSGDIRRIRRGYDQMKGDRRIVLTTEKDAARLREWVGKEAAAGLPIYYMPIEVRMHQTEDYNFDQTILNIVHDNIMFKEKLQNAKFDF